MRRIFVSIILVCVGLAFLAKTSRGAEFCVEKMTSSKWCKGPITVPFIAFQMKTIVSLCSGVTLPVAPAESLIRRIPLSTAASWATFFTF
jgi:hypothetical protein